MRFVTTFLLFGLAVVQARMENQQFQPLPLAKNMPTAAATWKNGRVTRSSFAGKEEDYHCRRDAAGTATSILSIRGGGSNVASMVTDSFKGLKDYMKEGARSDALVLLSTTALNTPLCKRCLKISPILGFLALGLLFGPNGINIIQDLHTTELLADFGVVLFLVEMGLHLSFKTLYAMRRTVFGLGGTQWASTALMIAGISTTLFGASAAASVVIGGALALSSSAFVLQLLKDKNEMKTTYGRTSFGVLLLQDLMVVPLLMVIPILAGKSGESVGAAIGSAILRMCMAIAIIAAIGAYALIPVYDFVASAQSREAFVGLIMSNVLGMSFLTEGLGLSNTLGAFLSGVLLSDTKYRSRVETEIAPIRGILVGIFFFSVGFEIDLKLIANKFGLVMGITAGILALKTALATAACRLFNLPMPTARRVGLVLSQGGEFAFVAFHMARSFGILKDDVCKLLLTCVSLTMVATPLLEGIGAKLETTTASKIAASASAGGGGGKKKKGEYFQTPRKTSSKPTFKKLWYPSSNLPGAGA